ncbi:DinB family protein [Glycomyces albus]
MKRSRPDLTAPEREMLEGFLDFHRQTLLHKCSGLDDRRLRSASVEPSGLSLLGLVRHLTDVEYWWFRENLLGDTDFPSYHSDEAPDAVFDPSGADPEETFANYHTAVASAREAAASRNLDDTFEHPHGRPATLRWLYLHMIEEYARHNGHADLLRERIDGATGQ